MLEKRRILPLLAAGLLCLPGAVSLAATDKAYTNTIVVGSSGDGTATDSCLGGTPSSCTLRAAIIRANTLPGPVLIEIDTGIHPILTLIGDNEDAGATGDLDIHGEVDIVGRSTTGFNVVTGTGGDRVFHIKGGARVEIVNLEITGGLIDSNETSIAVAGGGIFIEENGELKLFDSVVTQNQAPVGGGIANLGRFEMRSNTTGKSAIADNIALSADILAGAVSGPDLLNQNINPGQGGGVANFGGQLFLGGVTVSGNIAGIGGAIYNASAGIGFGNATITNTNITGNQSLTHGGAIANLGPMNVNNSAIFNNSSDAGAYITGVSEPLGDGGGIFNSATGSIELINVTISGNTARAGGGLYNSRNATLTNVTIYDNTAVPCTINCTEVERSQLGGHQVALFDTDAILGQTDPDLTIVNSVVANNPSSVTTATGRACMAWGNLTAPPPTAEEISDAVIAGFVFTLGGNLDTDGNCGFDNSADFPATAEPLNLLPLAINVPSGLDPASLGNTYTHAIDLAAATVSPLIDTANVNYCPEIDQRFLQRNDGSGLCDIGAFEASGEVSLYSAVVDLKVDISDDPDPVSANLQTADGQLNYRIGATNLYEGPPAENTVVTITLDPTLIYNYSTISKTGQSCDVSGNILTCPIGQLLGLERVEITVNVSPTQEGYIETEASVASLTGEAFEINNTASEVTEVTNSANAAVTNFGGSGGGGALHWLWLLAGGLGVVAGLRRWRH